MTAEGPYRTGALAGSAKKRTWRGRARSFWRSVVIRFSGTYRARRVGSAGLTDGNGDALVARAPRHVRRLGGLTCWHPVPFSLRDESFMRLLVIIEEAADSCDPHYLSLAVPPYPFGGFLK